jgi:N-acetylmuramoyl-L-alanine amidase
MKKAAIVIGHTEESQGACSPFNISCEWEFMFGVGTELVMRDKAELYLNDTYDRGYTSMVKRTAAQLNAGGHNLGFELHYNAATPKARGSEAVYYHDVHEDHAERKIAQYFIDGMAELGFKKRSPKQLKSARDRGYAATYHPKMDFLILEPFFGTNKEDVELITENYMGFVDLIEEIIDKHNEGYFD